MNRLVLLFAALLGAPAVAEDLTVATFNIRYASGADRGKRSWGSRKSLVVETIRKMNPDVLGVQEALSKQVDYLEEQLPDYRRIGVGRDDGKTKGEYSAIFYRVDRLVPKRAQAGTFWLSDTPEKAGSKSWGNGVVRICTWAEFHDRRTENTFFVFNTHWDHKHQGSRENSGKLIFRRAVEEHPAAAKVVMGDFNATEMNEAVKILLRTAVPAGIKDRPTEKKIILNPLRSAFFELHRDEPNRRTFNGFEGNREGKSMIDHILVTPHWKVKKAWIEYHHKDGIWPSDHYPVAAVLEQK